MYLKYLIQNRLKKTNTKKIVGLLISPQKKAVLKLILNATRLLDLR